MRTVFTIVALVMFSCLCGAGIVFLGHLTRDVDTITPEISAAAIGLQNTTTRAQGTLDTLNAAAQTQTVYWNKSAAETAKTVRAVRQLIDRTDRSLNDKLIPQLSAQSTAIGTQSQSDLDQLQRVLTDLDRAVEDTDAQIQNPAISASLANLANSTSELRGTMAEVHRASTDLAEAVHRETRPASFVVKTIGFAIDKVGALSGLILGLVK